MYNNLAIILIIYDFWTNYTYQQILLHRDRRLDDKILKYKKKKNEKFVRKSEQKDGRRKIDGGRQRLARAIVIQKEGGAQLKATKVLPPLII